MSESNNDKKTGFEGIHGKELVNLYMNKTSEIERGRIALEMNRRLIMSTRKFGKSSSIQSEKMIKLTGQIIWLTIALGLLTIIQVIKLFANIP